jgi:hypothetical protein
MESIENDGEGKASEESGKASEESKDSQILNFENYFSNFLF